jgi:hypothetical protein
VAVLKTTQVPKTSGEDTGTSMQYLIAAFHLQFVVLASCYIVSVKVQFFCLTIGIDYCTISILWKYTIIMDNQNPFYFQ